MTRVVRWLLLLCACRIAVAAEVVVMRPSELRAERYSDARSLGPLAAGTRVELVGLDAGWVQVRSGALTGWVRATGLAGDAATASALAGLETGRGATGNIVVAAGIRGIPKASRHALIIAPDGTEDSDAVRLIAARLGVPTSNIDVVDGAQANALDRAVAQLNDRVASGDQVLLYISDDRGSCAAGPLVERLHPALLTAEKTLIVSDPVDGSMASCSSSMATAAIASGIRAANVVQLQPRSAARPRRATGAGRFTEALTDCFLGDAADLDGSGSISVSELATCIEGSRAGIATIVTGNGAWSPLVGVPTQVSLSTEAPRTTIADVYGRRDGRITVDLTAIPDSLRIGQDDLGLRLTSNVAGFVYLVLLGSDGHSFYVLFPNDVDRDNRIAAGETLRLPRPNWRIRSAGPPGRDTVLAIVAESERDLASFAARQEGPFAATPTDGDARARLQRWLGRSGRADGADCVDGGGRRNLAAVRVCSDAFGAAIVDVVER